MRKEEQKRLEKIGKEIVFENIMKKIMKFK